MTPRGERSGGTTRVLLVVLAAYRHGISPLLPPLCRFEPSCSRYAEDALRVHGAGRGLLLTLRRLVRCRPGGGSGYDPVPPIDAGANSE